jgi:hypothetical protein
MKIYAMSGVCLAAFLVATAGAQETNLTRSEVAAIKAKIVTVQQAMGGDPAGYLEESEDFDLPTDFNRAEVGKYWPITSGVSLRYGDKGSAEAQANMEKAATEYQTKMAAAVASGNIADITRMSEELTRMQAAAMAPAERKEPMNVYVRLNQNPTAGIDPDAVVLEQPGVIALRDKGQGERGDVTVYIDPVALKATEELSKIELRTANDGVTNKTGVFHVVIQLNGTLADLEAWVQKFDFGAMLGVIDAQ